MDVERHNYQQIEMLNQRGGRTLSMVDLIQAGTISAEMAGYAMWAVEHGASLLCGARPGGAGKTTLMAAILNLLPPDVPIVTVSQSSVIADGLARPADEPRCYLAHEIGSGQYYGYIWGREVADFLALIDGPRRIASCLHADTLEELTGILCSPPLGVSREVLGRVGLVLFMGVDRKLAGYRRRVTTFYEAEGAGGHRLLFRWDRPSDTFRQVAEIRDPEGLGPYVRLIQRMVDEDVSDSQAVRRGVLQFYRRG